MKYIINSPSNHDKVEAIIAQLTPDIKTIGIVIPKFFGIEEQYEFFDSLCRVRANTQLVMIPIVYGNHINIKVPQGVIPVYIYEQQFINSLNQYDLQVKFVKDGIEFTTKDPGDKFVLSNKMKGVIGRLINRESSLLNCPEVEVCLDVVDPKMFSGLFLNNINLHKDIVDKTIADIKSHIKSDDTFDIKYSHPNTDGMTIFARLGTGPKGKQCVITWSIFKFRFPIPDSLESDWVEDINHMVQHGNEPKVPDILFTQESLKLRS